MPQEIVTTCGDFFSLSDKIVRYSLLGVSSSSITLVVVLACTFAFSGFLCAPLAIISPQTVDISKSGPVSCNDQDWTYASGNEDRQHASSWFVRTKDSGIMMLHLSRLYQPFAYVSFWSATPSSWVLLSEAHPIFPPTTVRMAGSTISQVWTKRFWGGEAPKGSLCKRT